MRAIVYLMAASLLAGCKPTANEIVAPIPDGPDRVWLGPAYNANRLQDWRIRAGRIQSIEGRRVKPMRTAHLQTVWLRPEGGEFRTKLLIHGLGDSSDASTWGGLLLGAGSAAVDYRISILSHHWPAREGGLIVAIDGEGRVVLRDNSTPPERTGPRGDYVESDWPLLTALTSPTSLPETVALSLEAWAGDGGYVLEAVVSDSETGEELARGQKADLPARFFEGTVALVSHGSPGLDGQGYAFSDWLLSGSKVESRPERAFGPVLGVQYTVSDGVLKMTAQFGPLGPVDAQDALLQIDRGGGWKDAASTTIHPNGYTATFRVEAWDHREAADFRVRYALDGELHDYEGVIRPEPEGEFTLAGLNCHHISGGDGSWTHEHFWYPHGELVEAVEYHDPDMLFFAGDQIYEGGLEGIVRAPADTAILDYLGHWFRFVRAFGELTRNRPTVSIPDDHDVYHGNIWGAGGKAGTGPYSPASDNGGYIMPPEFVNAVHRTQTSHLPDAVDPEPIAQDISVYYTTVEWGGVSFAVLADRMWKSAPKDMVPDADIWNGWAQERSFDAAAGADVSGAELLGARQEAYLDEWADTWGENIWMKVLLSQTPFVNVATIPEEAMSGAVIPGLPNPAPGEYPEGYRKAADFDSGGWPQTPRDRAVRSLRRAFAVHVAGDQHLGSVVQYGVDAYQDGGFAFTLPSIANIWPRRWFPPQGGENRLPEAPRYTGDYLDGFGNRMTVRAVANPVDSGQLPSALYDRVPGYGIIRLDPASRTTTFEAWPRWVDPSNAEAAQFLGWPITVRQEENYSRRQAGLLPRIEAPEFESPIVRVENEATGEWLYTLPWRDAPIRPWVFENNDTAYTVVLRDAATGETISFEGLRVTGDSTAVVRAPGRER